MHPHIHLAQTVRPDQPPLRGAKITGFTTSADGKTRKLVYQVAGQDGAVAYTDAGDGAWKSARSGHRGIEWLADPTLRRA